MGIGASIIVGWLMDRLGLGVCTALTLVLGLGQRLVIWWRPVSVYWLTGSFVVYVFFRQFLFPVYIASLTAGVGFKYFGLLNGLGFCTTGVAQLFMANLVLAVQGDCHMGTVAQSSCDTGEWMRLHAVESVILVLLLWVPWKDRIESQQRTLAIREFLESSVSSSFRSPEASIRSYGSVENL